MKKVWISGFLFLEILFSVITYFLYRTDKKRAIRHRYRISEKTLLIFPWIFGSLGALFGMFRYRHKTKHGYFLWNNLLAFLFQMGILLFLILGFS